MEEHTQNKKTYPPIQLTRQQFIQLAHYVADIILVKLDKLNQHSDTSESPVGREEMAKLLDISIATLDRLVAEDAIPSRRIKNRRLFFPRDVFKSLPSGKTEAA